MIVEEQTTFIYCLRCPETRAVFYVGKSVEPSARFRYHLGWDRHNLKKTRWVAGLTAKGLKPVLEILEECPADQWRERERFWETHFRSAGEPLTNIAECGQGRPYPPSKIWEGFVDPQGRQVPAIDNLQAWCRERGLQPASMGAVWRGDRDQHRGWTNCRPEAQERCRERAEIEWLRLWEGFVAPDGLLLPPQRGLVELCTKHGLDVGQMGRVYRGEAHSHKGWTNCRAEAKEALAQKIAQRKPACLTPEGRERLRTKISKTWEGFVDPKGNPVPPILNLHAWCEDRGLEPSLMQAVYHGKRSYHKGYTCSRPEAIWRCKERARNQEQSRAAQAASYRGVPRPPHVVEAIRKATIERHARGNGHHTPETLAKVRATWAAKMGAGYKESEEVRARRSASNCARWEKVERSYGPFVDPEGHNVGEITSLSAFALEHNLNASHILAVAKGTRPSHRGWACPTAWANRPARPLPSYIKTWEGFVDPKGNPMPPIVNLGAWAKKHGLEKSLLWKVAKGTARSHGGWTNPAAWSHTHPETDRSQVHDRGQPRPMGPTQPELDL